MTGHSLIYLDETKFRLALMVLGLQVGIPLGCVQLWNLMEFLLGFRWDVSPLRKQVPRMTII